jgi:uncharacterized protein YjbJ (UPF0337 family)
MNRDLLSAQWKQLRGEIRIQWGKLTDSDLDKVQGRWDQLVGLLQERYAYSKMKAEAELDAFLDGVTEKITPPRA